MPAFAKNRIVRSAAALLAAVSLFLPAVVAARVTDDTYFDSLWHLKKIGAPEAWETTLGFEGVIVAVIDTGVDIDHPDLKDNIWRNMGEIPGNGADDDGNGYVDDVNGWDFVDGDSDPRPVIASGDERLGAAHGTISAGVIAAKGDNGRGIVGVTWQTKVMPLRALGTDGQGDPLDVVRAVEYAVKNGAKVINLSLVGSVRDDLLRIALRRAYDAGVFVVAAAGNAPDGGEASDLDRTPRYPVCLDEGADENFVYGVAATDEDDRRAAFSNYGAGCIDLSAPGSRFISTVPYRPWIAGFAQPYGGYYNGTSIAASVVSGAVALMKSLDPNLTPKQLANILTATADNIDEQNAGYFGKLGRGRLNVARAVAEVRARQNPVEKPVATADLVPGGHTGGLVFAAPRGGRRTDIRVFTSDGALVRSFSAFSDGFTGGASLAVADFDGGGRRSVVAGAGPGGSSQVRVFDVNTLPIGGFTAYDAAFRGGVNVVAADLDGDGRDEIVTAPASGGGPHVRLFTARGVPMGGFMAFDSRERGGWQIAAADVNGDGRDEIAVLAGDGARLRVFDSQSRKLYEVNVPGTAAVRKGGVIVAADVNGDGREEVGVMRLEKGRPTAVFFATDGKASALFDLLTDVIGGRGDWAVGSLAGEAPVVRLPVSSGPAFSFQAFEKNYVAGVVAVRLD